MKPFQSLILLLFFIIIVISPSYSQEESSCPPPENKKAIKLFEKAKEYFYSKDRLYGDAYSSLKLAVTEEPDFAAAYYLMGLINIKRSTPNIKAAEQNFTKALELCKDFDSAYIYYYMGDISYGAQKYDLAVTYIEKFLKDVEKVKSDKDYDRAESILKFAKFYNNMLANPVPFNPRPVPGICTQLDEYLPTISPDNELALFTRVIKVSGQKGAAWQTGEKSKEVFMYSKRKKSEFQEAEEMSYPFNQSDNEGGPTLTIDNKTLYYTVSKYNSKNYYNSDIYMSTYSGGWSDIKNLGSNVNDPDSWDTQPSISSDGKTLYFVSDRKGGLGGSDIWYSEQNENGEWGPAVNMGAPINTAGNEKSPFIHGDDQTFYFSSEGHLGMGGYDIFYSKRNLEGKWTNPINIGYPINTSENEVTFFVSTDGKYGYFASNKYQGQGGWDIFSFDLYEKARPEKVLFVKGELKNEETKEAVKAKIELKNVDSKKVTEIPVDTVTGEYAAVVLFRSDYIMTVKKEGFGFESKYISMEDTIFKEPAKIDLEIKPIAIGKTYNLNDIYFATNSFVLNAGSKHVIDDFIQFLKENPEIKISIQGYTDNVGDDKSNLMLSENRARSVYRYIIECGIDKSRLSYKGFGETLPVASNLTEEGRAKNRRTVFVITGK
jgi:outer membrane protein OmpA-like peptidoglycan-associated protein/tetratricopeptide (TPR) repeat protein